MIHIIGNFGVLHLNRIQTTKVAHHTEGFLTQYAELKVFDRRLGAKP